MATGYTPPGATCCCGGGDCYTSAVESLCLTLNVECAGWAGEQVTLTKTGGATVTHCGTECVPYVGTIGNPCGSLNTVEVYLPCPASGPPSAPYVFVFVYNVGLVFPQGPCRAFSTDPTLACTFTSEGYTPPEYPLRWNTLGGDTGPDCIDICGCELVNGALAGSVTFSAAPCGEALMAAAAPAAARGYRPPPPARPRICLYAERVEFLAGCSGFRCRHRCTSSDPGVRAALGDSDLVLPADECQTCPGYLPRP